jgi:CysZ protein
VPLLLLFFVPLLNLLAPPAWLLFGAWMLAMEYLDYPLGNRGLLFSEVRARATEQRSLTLGFGIGVLCLTLIPLLNFVAIPSAVAGATRLALERMVPAGPPA